MKPKHDNPINFVIRVQSDFLVDVYPQDEKAKAYCQNLWISEDDGYKVTCYPMLGWDGILESVLAEISDAGMRAYVYHV